MVLKAGGFTNEGIAASMKIDPTTLVKYYAEELKGGLEQVMGKVVATMFQVAMDKNHPKMPLLAIYLTKTRLGWKDTPEKDDDNDDDFVEVISPTIGKAGSSGAS
jgi:hypothetical protein